MNFFETEFAITVWKVICVLLLIGFMYVIGKSAINSWKTSKSIISILDEVVEGFLVVVVFLIIVNQSPSAIIQAAWTPVEYILGIIKNMFSQLTGIPM